MSELKKLSDQELSAQRSQLENVLVTARQQLKELVAEFAYRQAVKQVELRYGAAGIILLETLGLDVFKAKLAELIRSGRLKDKTQAVPVSGVAGLQLEAQSPTVS